MPLELHWSEITSAYFVPLSRIARPAIGLF